MMRLANGYKIRYDGNDILAKAVFSNIPPFGAKKGEEIMNTFDYIVVSIDGDYANLRRTDIQSDELKLVARALLPDTIAEGTKLHYEYMEYSIVE